MTTKSETKKPRGRPRKNPHSEALKTKEASVPKKRGRPPKNSYVPRKAGPMVMGDSDGGLTDVELMSNSSDEEWAEKKQNGKSHNSSDADNKTKFNVEALLQYDAKTKKYLVKWEGYPDSDNTWEPSRNIPFRCIQDFDCRQYYESKTGQKALQYGTEQLIKYRSAHRGAQKREEDEIRRKYGSKCLLKIRKVEGLDSCDERRGGRPTPSPLDSPADSDTSSCVVSSEEEEEDEDEEDEPEEEEEEEEEVERKFQLTQEDLFGEEEPGPSEPRN